MPIYSIHNFRKFQIYTSLLIDSHVEMTEFLFLLEMLTDIVQKIIPEWTECPSSSACDNFNGCSKCTNGTKLPDCNGGNLTKMNQHIQLCSFIRKHYV